jgi:transporter family protein
LPFAVIPYILKVLCLFHTKSYKFNFQLCWELIYISKMWWIYALLSALFAALTALFAKKGVHNIDSDAATAIRTAIILVMAWTIVLFKKDGLNLTRVTGYNWLFLILSGVATGASWIFYFKALQIGKLSQVAPVDKSSLALTILLAAIFLGEPITIKTGIGALLIIAGTLLTIF